MVALRTSLLEFEGECNNVIQELTDAITDLESEIESTVFGSAREERIEERIGSLQDCHDAIEQAAMAVNSLTD